MAMTLTEVAADLHRLGYHGYAATIEQHLALAAKRCEVPDGYVITLVREGLIRISETIGTKDSPGQSSLIDQSRYPVGYGLLKAMLATATQSEAGS